MLPMIICSQKKCFCTVIISALCVINHFSRLFRRGNLLGVAGWAVVARALERVTSLKTLNGCKQYTSLVTGELPQGEMKVDQRWELGEWVVGFLERSASSLTKLDLR